MSHHGLFWMSLFTAYPGIEVYKPLGANEAVKMLFHAAGKRKVVLVISGGQVMANVLAIVPELEERVDLKIVAVTSPQLYEELRQRDPRMAREIFSDEDRQIAITLHNGWRGFLYPFLLPADHAARSFGMDDFSRSGKPGEIYKEARFDAAGLKGRILRAIPQ